MPSRILGRHDRIVEIAALTLDPKTWEPVDEYDTLINPERDLGPVGLHGITASMVESAPVFSEVAAALAGRIHHAILVAHNLSFDSRMLAYEFARRRWCADSARWASSGRHVDHRDRRRVMISM